ncbi:MAG: ABC transporter permease, partial [Terriglobales bacterium]
MANFSVIVEEFLASLRRIRRHPRMPLVLVVALATALGSIVGVTDVAREVLHAPLVYRRPARIVVARDHVSGFLVSAYNWQPNPRAHSVFSRIAEYHFHSTILAAGPGHNRRVMLAYVTPGFFSVLGVKMFIGRGLPNAPPASPRHKIAWLPIVLSYHLWREEFGVARNVVGREIRLNFLYPYRFQVVGVAPRGLRFPRGVDAWIPEHLDSFSVLQTAGPPDWADFTIARL